MKKILLLIFLVAMAMGLSACSASNSSNNNEKSEVNVVPHGVNVVPIVQSNGSITTVLVPY